MAVQGGANIETIERLVKLQQEMFERNAKVAFDHAMHRAQSNMRRIGVDATNPQTRSKYATYGKLDGAIRPVYTAEGLSLSFDTGDSGVPEVLRVLCYVSHAEGHTRTYRVDMPADGKGAKGGDVMTKTHATGAAMSYGMRYLLKMIFNVAVGETDDDGNNGATAGPSMSDGDIAHYKEQMEAARNFDELRESFKKAFTAAKGLNDDFAQKDLTKTYEKMKKEVAK
jgi:hypothetical protein